MHPECIERGRCFFYYALRIYQTHSTVHLPQDYQRIQTVADFPSLHYVVRGVGSTYRWKTPPLRKHFGIVLEKQSKGPLLIKNYSKIQSKIYSGTSPEGSPNHERVTTQEHMHYEDPHSGCKRKRAQ